MKRPRKTTHLRAFDVAARADGRRRARRAGRARRAARKVGALWALGTARDGLLDRLLDEAVRVGRSVRRARRAACGGGARDLVQVGARLDPRVGDHRAHDAAGEREYHREPPTLKSFRPEAEIVVVVADLLLREAVVLGHGGGGSARSAEVRARSCGPSARDARRSRCSSSVEEYPNMGRPHHLSVSPALW